MSVNDMVDIWSTPIINNFALNFLDKTLTHNVIINAFI